MEIYIPNPTFELAETFFSIASTLSPEQTLYLARHKKLLEKWLSKMKTNLVTDQISETPILAQSAVSIKKVLYRPEMVDRTPDGNADLMPICPATKEGIVYEYKLNSDLFPGELIEYLGGQQSLKKGVFGLQQIRALAIKQNTKKKYEGLLQLNSNYFPVLNKHGNICFASIYLARYKSSSKLRGAHSWEFHLCRKDKIPP